MEHGTWNIQPPTMLTYFLLICVATYPHPFLLNCVYNGSPSENNSWLIRDFLPGSRFWAYKNLNIFA